MKFELKHNIVSVILLLCFLLPIGIGLSHALHHHNDATCDAKNETHIHEDSQGCDHLHYFNNTNSFSAIIYDSHDTIVYAEKTFSLFSFQTYFLSVNTLSDRGPPFIIVC